MDRRHRTKIGAGYLTRTLTLALDAMGGDAAPAVVVEGAAIARERHPDVAFVFYGREEAIRPLVAKHPALLRTARFVHTEDMVSGEDKPGTALRRGRKSSMALAIEAVKAGEADVAVSAGNTGALMALAKFILRTMPGIDRPALASLLPTANGECVMLDLGANVECSPSNLVEFAVMGAAFARSVLGIGRPRVCLLNIGVEELKGNDEVRQAAEILRHSSLTLDFLGFIEADKIAEGDADVIVTDGFTGNVALKAMEGTARLIARLLGAAFRNSLLARLGYVLAKGGLSGARTHLDPNNHNGAVMLGLAGLVVKSHGGTSASGFATAIGVAVDMARHNLIGQIAGDLGGVAADGALAPPAEMRGEM